MMQAFDFLEKPTNDYGSQVCIKYHLKCITEVGYDDFELMFITKNTNHRYVFCGIMGAQTTHPLAVDPEIPRDSWNHYLENLGIFS